RRRQAKQPAPSEHARTPRLVDLRGMMYCWRCPLCDCTAETPIREAPLCHPEYTTSGHSSPVSMKRDYRAEAASPTVAGLKREREAGGARALRDHFLPKASDFAGPSDPEGTRGIRAWADRHGPKEGNRRPLWPDIPRRSF